MFSMAGNGDGPRRRSAHLFAEPGVGHGEKEKRDAKADEEKIAHGEISGWMRGASGSGARPGKGIRREA
jgi:hypothetical protein